MRHSPIAGLQLLSALALIALAPACTYGPVQERTRIENARERFNSHSFAVALNWQRFRAPTGLSKFPDGGTPLVLGQAALFYACDVDSSRARLLARITRPKGMESGFEPWVMGWGSDCLYVKLTGRRYSWRHGAVGDLNMRFYRVGLDGTCAQVPGIPDLVGPNGRSWSPMRGETTYLRVSAGYDSIDVYLEERQGRRGAFIVNQARGILEPARKR